MNEMFSLSIDDFPPVEALDGGPAPQLQWIELSLFVVDRSYQRDIVKAGRKQILHIAKNFNWSFFTPVIAAPVEGGRFAIIDGQHRSIAALLAGKVSVPCMIVIADGREQARAFSAINGNITRMSALSTFRAALAGGDPETVALDALARRAGVRILGYPMQASRMQPGDCTCPAALATLRGRFGDEALFSALLAVACSSGDIRGLVNPVVIRGLCMFFAARPLSDAAVRAVFAHIDVAGVVKEALKEVGFSLSEDIKEVVARRLARIAARGRAA